MLFWENYQSTPDRFGNYQLAPDRSGYILNGRGRVMFFKRAEKYFREGPFIMHSWHMEERDVETFTFESKKNGYIFKLVGRYDQFYLLQVNRATDNMWSGSWYMPAIWNYFGVLAFVLKETGGGCSAELMGFDC